MDVRSLGFLNNNSSLNIVYYLTNYLSKYGLTTYDSITYALLAFKKYEMYKQSEDNDSARARKICSMMYNAAASRTEYSGAQVASMIRNNGRDGTYYSSHETIVINLYVLLSRLESMNDSEDFVLIPNQFTNEITYFGTVYDYEHRHVSLENKCLYEFVSEYKRIKPRSPKNEYIQFKDTHRQFKTDYLKKNEQELVPFILGENFPRKNDLTNRKKYAKMILILFKPWTNLFDFNDRITSFEDQLDSYLVQLDKTFSFTILQYIENIEYLR